jgi:hypothetical protein
MGVIFTPGQILDTSDLDLFLRNAAGNPVNAFEITYALCYVDSGPPETEVLLGSPTRIPINPSVGVYFASMMIPPNATLGDYRIKWSVREFAGAPQSLIVQEFGVVNTSAVATPVSGMTLQEAELVECLRILLRDWNPDKHYHFCPPEHEAQIGQMNRVFGFVWEDLELLHYLRMALDEWNTFPPNTASMTCSLTHMMGTPFTSSWRGAIMWGAIVHAMFALARNWLHDEFDYSIGGISLSINKSSGYESLKGNAEGQFDKFIQAKKDTVLIIRGLQQPKYGIGIRSSFGPHVGGGVLSPRGFVG